MVKWSEREADQLPPCVEVIYGPECIEPYLPFAIQFYGMVVYETANLGNVTTRNSCVVTCGHMKCLLFFYVIEGL